MLKYRFSCDDKDDFISQINEKMSYDRPNEMGRYAYPLFVYGFHFTQCGERIKGFYVINGQRYRGGEPPFRSKFSGIITEENGKTFFDVQFYPQLLPFWGIIAVIVLSLIVLKAYFLSVLALVFLFIYVWLFFKATKEAIDGFKRMTAKNEGE